MPTIVGSQPCTGLWKQGRPGPGPPPHGGGGSASPRLVGGDALAVTVGFGPSRHGLDGPGPACHPGCPASPCRHTWREVALSPEAVPGDASGAGHAGDGRGRTRRPAFRSGDDGVRRRGRRASPVSAASDDSPRPGTTAPRPCSLEERALDHARRLAADWRAAGMRVSRVERVSAGGWREAYELTAEDATGVAAFACRAWRWPGGLPSSRTVWTVAVSARRADGPAGGRGPAASRPAGGRGAGRA